MRRCHWCEGSLDETWIEYRGLRFCSEWCATRYAEEYVTVRQGR